jgi:hypothetical protein
LAFGVGLFLYFTHLSKFTHALNFHPATQVWASDEYLRHSYFQPGHDNLLVFLLSRTNGVFQFAFGQVALGAIGCVLFIVGLALLFVGKVRSDSSRVNSHHLGLFLLVSFVPAAAASLARMYPYGGTRHSSFLLIFVAAGISVCVARIAMYRLGFALSGTALLIISCVAFQPGPQIPRADQHAGLMLQAMQFVHQKISRSDLIVLDNQAAQLVGHYLCQQKIVSFVSAPRGFTAFECDGYRTIVDQNTWSFSAQEFLFDLQRLEQLGAVKTGESICVIDAGWTIGLARQLQAQVPEFHSLQAQSFGENIQILKVNIGQQTPALDAN